MCQEGGRRGDLGSDVLSSDSFVVEDSLEGAIEEVDPTEAVRDFGGRIEQSNFPLPLVIRLELNLFLDLEILTALCGERRGRMRDQERTEKKISDHRKLSEALDLRTTSSFWRSTLCKPISRISGNGLKNEVRRDEALKGREEGREGSYVFVVSKSKYFDR